MFNFNNKDEKTKKTESITISAYELQATYDTLYETLEWLELYVEKAGYYPDWQNKKQIPKTITRTDINSIGSTRMKSIFSTSLFGLRNLTKNKPNFLLERLEEEFFKWLDGSGIKNDNCPIELAQSLLNISEVLKGKGDEFAKARVKEVNERIEKMSKEERREKFSSFVSAYQEPLDNEGERAKSLERKTYNDVSDESKFHGSDERGKEIFKQISDNLMDTNDDFPDENPERIRRNFIKDIKQNINKWSILELVVGNYGRKQLFLVHQLVQKDTMGYLMFDGEKTLNKDRFSNQEWSEIEQVWNNHQMIKQQRIEFLSKKLSNLSKVENIELIIKLEDKIGELEAKIKILEAEPNKSPQSQQQVDNLWSQSNELRATLNSISITDNEQNAGNNFPIFTVIGIISLLGLIIHKIKKNKVKK